MYLDDRGRSASVLFEMEQLSNKHDPISRTFKGKGIKPQGFGLVIVNLISINIVFRRYTEPSNYKILFLCLIAQI